MYLGLGPGGQNAIPNGHLRPDVKVSIRFAFSAPSSARNTRICPAKLSATKISPLGATRTKRGPSKPFANSLTTNPVGTLNFAFGGRATTSGPFPAERLACGGGK